MTPIASIRSPRRRPALWRTVYWALVAGTGVALVALSRHIAILDQSDYARAIDFMLRGNVNGLPSRPLDAPLTEWAFRTPVRNPLGAFNAASVYFWAIGLLQRCFRDSFSVLLMGAISKTLVVLLAGGIAFRLAKSLRFGGFIRIACFAVIAAVFFMAHNVLLLNSFYQEHVLFIALPLLLFGMLDDLRWRRIATIGVAVTLAGAAKIQYFYLPALYLSVVVAMALLRRRWPDRALLAALLVSQLYCAFLVPKNNDRDYNYYHSTYFGSYYVLSGAELDALGVPVADRHCIGIDAFGVQLSGRWAQHSSDGHVTCYRKGGSNARTAFEPYWRFPDLIFRLWSFARHAHWTANYFLLDTDRPYAAPIDGATFGSGDHLFRLSALREEWLTGNVFIVSAVTLLLAGLLIKRRHADVLASAMVFLAIFLTSQIAVSLVGEGLRDLSKHLAAAQFCLDLEFALMLIAIVALLKRPRPA